MPDESGRIPPVRIPEVPWLQTFEVGDRVRISDDIPLRGAEGEVVAIHTGMAFARAVYMVKIDERTDLLPVGCTPGQLRRVS